MKAGFAAALASGSDLPGALRQGSGDDLGGGRDWHPGASHRAAADALSEWIRVEEVPGQESMRDTGATTMS
jgi:hypothetical protein